jgi:phosphoglycerate kinase
MHTLDSYNFASKKALVRVDFNVPLDGDFHVTDDTRIRAAIPTIKKIIAGGGSVVLMSHLGRPTPAAEDRFSLRHIVSTIENLLEKPIKFSQECVGEKALASSANLQPGDVLLLENLRFHPEETAGDEFFAGQLAEHGDVYVNDAFGTAHRSHASTAVIAKFFPHDKLFGYVMENEVANIDKVLHASVRPVTAIIGGAKVSSKISILENLLEKCDHVLIGGGMAFTFIKALGGEVGSSMVEDDKLDMALTIIQNAKTKGVQIHLPSDAVIADAFSNDANIKSCSINTIPNGWMGLDIGEKSTEAYCDVILKSKTVLWNGPMGVFEMSNFSHGTKSVALCLAEATKSHGTFTLVGGGDSVAAINAYDLSDDVSYVSTGGGAMLEYLEGKVLPGIAAIRGN